MFNFHAGDMAAGDRGLLNDPARSQTFRRHVPIALELAEQLHCTRLNALVGVGLPEATMEEQLASAGSHVAWAADEAEQIGATVLIEALNTIENGPYLISSTAAGASFVQSIRRPNVKLQYDVYHMQRMEGDLANNFTRYLDHIAHVQIADCPGRREPGTGEINFDFFLRIVEMSGYSGWVGLEYRPAGDSTDESLSGFRASAAGVLIRGTTSRCQTKPGESTFAGSMRRAGR
jgi:hydroxypyruvate isomerase